MGLESGLSTFLILFFLVLVSVSLTQGAKAPMQCYMCSNDISYEECTYYQSNGTCKPHEDRCLKAKWDIATLGTISTGYIKGCTTKDKCSTQAHALCNSTEGYSICEVFCCEGDLCNDTSQVFSSRLVVTTLVLLACLIWYH